MKTSIIIPVFNEENGIENNLTELSTYMTGYAGPDGWEVIVVNDGSDDKTLEVLRKAAGRMPWLRVVDLGHRCGRGKALRAGMDTASGERIVTLDADLSYAPYHIERLLDKLERDQADIVVASAYGKGGTVRNVPWRRLWISRVGNKILSYMFGGTVTVLTCMVRAYKNDFIKRLDLHSDDKEIHLEIMSKAKILGARIAEVPADLHWRKEKLSKSTSVQPQRRATLKVRRTSSTHLFFAMLSKPGVIFWIPGILLMAISFFVLSTIVTTMVASDFDSGLSLYQTVRNSMVKAPISWITMAFSFVLGIQFFTLGFLTNQSKKNQEETYKTLHSIYHEVKNRKG